jgi:putative phosphoesterase
MRVGVVSDSHRALDALWTAVEAMLPVNAILHAGDETADAQWLAERCPVQVRGVAGNWDRPSQPFPLEQVLDEFGARIYLTHGHRLGVKEGLDELVRRARQLGARIAVYGHTHRFHLAVSEGILILNPGSLSSPRGHRERTFGMLDMAPTPDGIRVTGSIVSLRGARIDRLSVDLPRKGHAAAGDRP